MPFASVVIEGWIIIPHEDWMFDCSSEVLVLPSHFAEVVYHCGVTCSATLVIYGRGGFEMVLEPQSKCSGRFTHILFITFYPTTPVSVDYPTFVSDSNSGPGCHQEFLMVHKVLLCKALQCELCSSLVVVFCCCSWWDTSLFVTFLISVYWMPR